MSGASALGTLCSGSLVRRSRYMHHVCVWFACELALLSGIARWSLQVAIAADRCAELSPFHLSLCHVGQRCLGLQRWVLSVLARSCVRAADMHDLCLWFFRASWRSLGIARWSLRLLLTAALELCPFTHHCAISARDVRGFSIFRWVLCVWVCSRFRAADTHDSCVWLWRGSCSAASGRNTLVTSGGERC